ncbi:MAG: glycoside hydrolase family 1 protein [Candidatus Saccharimonadales bacterium]
MSQQNKTSFPKDFLWGASTAGHQVEGGNQNQWTVWEQQNAERLAKTADVRLKNVPVWGEIKELAQNPKNYISGKGVEHYTRYKEDFDLLKQLNLNAFRFSIEWSRIEPAEGSWDEDEIKHYREYIEELKKRDIEPILNIWHWTMPTWFTAKGGFEKRANIDYFVRFSEKIIQEYGSDLKYIITLNEPSVYMSKGYLVKDWPPGQRSLINALKVYFNLAKAHRRAYGRIKDMNPELQVGIAAQLANIQAKRPNNLADRFSTKLMRYFWNWWFLLRIRRQQDFIGINYYFTDYYTGAFKRKNPKLPINDLGWYMEPEGLYPLLIRTWTRFKKPILVSENGLADMNDKYRQWWIEETIVSMQRAISEGVEVKGYLHWSLLDNFEWAEGWWPKFGLVEVDKEQGMKRTVRQSARWFADKIKELS